MDQKSYIEFKNKHLKQSNVYYIENNNELEKLLLSFNPRECNLVGYVWHEYGFIPIFLESVFEEFFKLNKNNGNIIGLCLPGQEFLYRNKVDILIVSYQTCMLQL